MEQTSISKKVYFGSEYLTGTKKYYLAKICRKCFKSECKLNNYGNEAVCENT